MVAQVDIKLKAGRFSEAFGTELYPGITPQVHAVPKLELDMSCLMVDHSRREFRPNSMIACEDITGVHMGGICMCGTSILQHNATHHRVDLLFKSDVTAM